MCPRLSVGLLIHPLRSRPFDYGFLTSAPLPLLWAAPSGDDHGRLAGPRSRALPSSAPHPGHRRARRSPSCCSHAAPADPRPVLSHLATLSARGLAAAAMFLNSVTQSRVLCCLGRTSSTMPRVISGRYGWLSYLQSSTVATVGCFTIRRSMSSYR